MRSVFAVLTLIALSIPWNVLSWPYESKPCDGTKEGSAASTTTCDNVNIYGNCDTTTLTYDTPALTTNQGVRVGDDENSLKANARGPTLLEDFILRDKITHFDHERIPERVVHARGSGAHGYFENYRSLSSITKADLFQRAGQQTEVFVRFSTVAGGAGSVDLPRDVRGFATRFYTSEGNWDLVGNNIPVFFIQDAMKFPDLVHSVKMEPDRGFPQSATAHRNFWDFISMMPESMHMIMWAMSDRTIPRSLRFMQGFGVNTFTFVNSTDGWQFVKFHWKPKAGMQSVLWDEAVHIDGADQDYHRRDLWESIEGCNETNTCPEWELGVQLISQSLANNLTIDVLDATKLIPEELVPILPIGRMVLNRNPANFFAETEQIAFHPGSVVPGIDFSNDPLLQGRLFSYIDTQLTRLGGPNFPQIPINRPKCPVMNLYRDGFMQQSTQPGRINYSPNSAGVPGVGEITQKQKFYGRLRDEAGATVRARAASFADHYSQARLFYLSQTVTEQNHIAMALKVELSKTEEYGIRSRMIGHLLHIDQSLATRVATQLGIDVSNVTKPTTLRPVQDPTELAPSLSIIANAPNNTISGRQVAVLISDGSSASVLRQIQSKVVAAGAKLVLVADHLGVIGGTRNSVEADRVINEAHSALFDSVMIVLSSEAAQKFCNDSDVVEWVSAAYSHLKIIGYNTDAKPLLDRAHIVSDEGIIDISKSGVDAYISMAKKIKIWDREPNVRSIP